MAMLVITRGYNIYHNHPLSIPNLSETPSHLLHSVNLSRISQLDAEQKHLVAATSAGLFGTPVQSEVEKHQLKPKLDILNEINGDVSTC